MPVTETPALLTKVTDVAILLHFVAFQDSQLNLPSLTFILPGSGARCLPLPGSSTKPQRRASQSGLFLNVGQRTPVSQGPAGKDQSLLVRMISSSSSWILAFTFSTASEGSASTAMVFYVRNLHLGGDSTADGGPGEKAQWRFLQETLVGSDPSPAPSGLSPIACSPVSP